MHGRFTIAELPEYRRRSQRLLGASDNTALIDHLSRYPYAGVLVPDTGGIRKLRWAMEGKGKRGGVRVIYYVYNEHLPVYLLTIFAKNEKADLSMEERQTLAKLVALLKRSAGSLA